MSFTGLETLILKVYVYFGLAFFGFVTLVFIANKLDKREDK